MIQQERAVKHALEEIEDASYNLGWIAAMEHVKADPPPSLSAADQRLRRGLARAALADALASLVEALQ
jgi:hypothetical protein